jgi:hypothetical protein
MMPTKNLSGSGAHLLVAGAAFAMVCSSSAWSQNKPSGPGPSVAQQVTAIESDPNPQYRYKAMRELAEVLRKNSDNVVEGDVRALATLLRDSDDLVRGRAAVALGLIGSRAMSAVPDLRRALSEVECVRADNNSRFVIARALERIGVPANRPECVATPHYGLETRR